MTHRERVMAVIHGEKPDRPAASFWRHFYHREHNAEGTAGAMLWFQDQFDWDFMKINPRAEYHAESWGQKLEFSHDEFTKHRRTKYPVETLEDWKRIEPLKMSTPVLDEHLEVVSRIRKKVGRDLPVLMTVFTPLAVAGRFVADNELLARHLREHPDVVAPAIEAITQTFEKYAEELRHAGADGLFFATTQWASSNLIDWATYQQFGVPYDLRVIQRTGPDALNLLHVCSSCNFLKELSEIDYHCRLYNWDSEDPTNPPLDAGKELFTSGALIGGVDQQGWLLHANAREIAFKTDELIDRLDWSRIILGPGCSVPPEVPLEHFRTIREKL